MKTERLLNTGFLIPIMVWGTTFICGIVMGNYNHLTRMVSELGTIGTPSQYLFTAGLTLSSILSILFVAGLYKTCKTVGLHAIPVLILLPTFSFSIGGAGLFPLPLPLHGLFGIPSMFLVLSPLLALLLWKNQPANFKYMAVISIVLISLGFLVLSPDILGDYIGLKQRFFHVGWSVWFVYLSIRFMQILKKHTNV